MDGTGATGPLRAAPAPPPPVAEAVVVRGQRLLDAARVAPLGLLRRHCPVLPLGPNVVLTGRADVLAVLDDPDAFALPYGPRLTGPFLLGLTGDEHEHDQRALTRATVEGPVARLAQRTAEQAEQRVAAGRRAGSLDVGSDLVHPVMADSVRTFLGAPTGDPALHLRQARDLFQSIFLNPSGLASVRRRGRSAGDALAAQVDHDVAERREQVGRGAPEEDDVLGRLLRAQQQEGPSLDDRRVRDALIGTAIGWLFHFAKAAVVAVDELLDRPDALAQARGAAHAEDPDALRRVLWEVLRFRPVQAGLLRTCARDAQVGADGSTRTVDVGTSVFAATHSAMWDEDLVPDPDRFDPTRADGQYLIFGAGPHRCLGEPLVRVQLPALLGPLLRSDGLRRADGTSGALRWDGVAPDGLRVALAL
jgi:cytochrome P450